MDYKIKNEYLSIFNIYKYSYQIYNENIKNIIKICLFIFIPLFFIATIFPDYNQFSLQNLNIIGIQYTNTILVNIFFMLIITTAFDSMLIGAITHIVINHIKSKDINFYTMLDNSLLKWGKLAVTHILYIVIIVTSSVLIIPGIFFGVLFYFVVQSILVTDGKIVESFKLSINLVKNKWFSLLWFLVLIFIINSLFVYFVMSIYQLFLLMVTTLLFSINSNIVLLFFNLLEYLILQIIQAYFVLVTSLKFINLYYLFKNKN